MAWGSGTHFFVGHHQLLFELCFCGWSVDENDRIHSSWLLAVTAQSLRYFGHRHGSRLGNNELYYGRNSVIYILKCSGLVISPFFSIRTTYPTHLVSSPLSCVSLPSRASTQRWKCWCSPWSSPSTKAFSLLWVGTYLIVNQSFSTKLISYLLTWHIGPPNPGMFLLIFVYALTGCLLFGTVKYGESVGRYS